LNPFALSSFDRLVNPEAFGLLLLVALIWLVRLRRKRAGMTLSGIPPVRALNRTAGNVLRWIYEGLQLAAILFLVIALARPQVVEKSREKLPRAGVDIVIAMDVSRSMEAEDLKPNRLEAAKKAAQDFVAARPGDRIGLVIYSGESITACPPTTQHVLLQNIIRNVDYQTLEDGTAIGLGLANAVNRLKDSRAKSKVIVLLTDGENNAGFIAPRTAAAMARRLKIKVYTIGVGRTGLAPFPIRRFDGSKTYQQVPFSINEELLRQIASQTGGNFYRADSREALTSIYRQIDALEKSKVQEAVQYTYREVFMVFARWALVLLLIAFLLRYTFFRSVI